MPKSTSASGEIRIGDWTLVAELNLLRCADREMRLEPRHADLLVFLSAHGGEVVSTEDIIENVWHGQVVTDQSVYQAVAKLRKAFADSASQPRYIETVSKRGYRLIAEVSAFAAGTQRDCPTGQATPLPSQQEPGSPSAGRGGKRRWMLAGLVSMIVLLGALWFFGRPQDLGGSYHTVAVLPFAALSVSDTEQLIAEGFSIELANALGRSGQVRVIGPISAKLASTLGNSRSEIGRHLDADLIVDGSIRDVNEQLSVSGVITEVESGHRLWSEVFDRRVDDVLAIQREVANAIADALWRTVEGGAPLSQPDTPPMQPLETEVYDKYLLGRYYRSRRTQKDLQRALGYFGEALKLDPDYVPAIRGTAACHLLLSFYGDEPLSKAMGNAQPFLERAVALAPDDAELLALIGLSHSLKGEPGIAEEFLMRAVSTHPNLVEGWMWLGLAREQQDRLRDAHAPLERASHLEPLMVTTVVNHANALSRLGRVDEAIALLDDLASTANETFDNRAQLYRVLSGAHRLKGSLVDAHAWASRALAAAPQSALSKANMAVTLVVLGQFEQAAELARASIEQDTPGQGVMEYLTRANAVVPGILPKDLIQARLTHLQYLPDVPEIEWRRANLDVGMLAYFDDELRKAVSHLRKALDGRTYPITRADDDIFVCLSLTDAMQRNNLTSEAEGQLSRCEQDMQNATNQGWDTNSLTISRVRLAILHDDEQSAVQLLDTLFERGFRNPSLLLNDPILKRLQPSESYQRLLDQATDAINADWKAIADNTGA
jgi:DNA-binding winged helix-turn-helix (wHTH) protein/TolB-like protein/Flp pilus assembly protein TadD